MAQIVELPVIFGIGAGQSLAVANSLDYVNSLVNGNNVITGLETTNAGAPDILQSYATKAFAMAGLTATATGTLSYYLDEEGCIHCATNVIRNIPDSQWWNLLKG